MELDFAKFHDENSPFYQQCLKETSTYINARLTARLRMLDKYDVDITAATPQAYVNAICDVLRNLVQSFFKVPTDKCQHCDKTGKLQRCHPHDQSRIQAALCAVQEQWQGSGVPLNLKSVLTKFLQVQANKPIFFMCPSCHRAFDKCDVQKTSEFTEDYSSSSDTNSTMSGSGCE